MLERLGFHFAVVAEQDQFDGRFPTVKSPNPENAEALKLGISLAEKQRADLVIATDPDCDRMGVAVRPAKGEMILLTGNQILALLAFYRTKTLFAQGVLNARNASRGVLIKTFVTTDMVKAIAEKDGLRCIETLTGFKYNGAKLEKYEQALPAEVRAKYRDLPEDETRRLRLAHSSFYIVGGEESYGYSGADFVRDKDGNGAAIMFCEVAAYAKSRGLTIDGLLDEVYAEIGFYLEKNGALTFEGAEGAVRIQKLLATYVSDPPNEMLGSKVTAVKNFETEIFRDVEGDEIPREKMLIFELADRTRIAVRGSGTEPKIKYYLFAQRRPGAAGFMKEELDAIKVEVGKKLELLWKWLQEDAHRRLAA
jgi:phosphoglucomutase